MAGSFAGGVGGGAVLKKPNDRATPQRTAARTLAHQSAERGFDGLEVADLPPHGAGFFLRQRPHAGGRAAGGLGQGEQVLDLAKGKTQLLRPLDETQALEMVTVVKPVARGRSFEAGEQALLFIKAEGFGSDPRRLRSGFAVPGVLRYGTTLHLVADYRVNGIFELRSTASLPPDFRMQAPITQAGNVRRGFYEREPK
jgi:hypothetical protein